MKKLKNEHESLEVMLAKEQSKKTPNQDKIALLELHKNAVAFELELAYQGVIILAQSEQKTEKTKESDTTTPQVA